MSAAPQFDLFGNRRDRGGRPAKDYLANPLCDVAVALDTLAEEAKSLRAVLDAPILLQAHLARLREAAATIELQAAVARKCVALCRERGRL